MITITTDRKYNFTKAETGLFSWDHFDGTNGGILLHKPSGKQIYQMRWIGADGYATEPVDDETRQSASEFWAELRRLREQKPPVDPADYYNDDPEPRHCQSGYCRKCHSYCYGDCEAN